MRVIKNSEPQVFGWNGWGKPNAVIRSPEGEAICVHGRSVDPQDDRAAVARADLQRGVLIRRQVDVLSAARDEARCKDRIEVCACGTVEQYGRGLGGSQVQVDRNTVTLRCPDAPPVVGEREALLVIFRDDLVESVTRDLMSCLFQGAQQVIHLDPAAPAK